MALENTKLSVPASLSFSLSPSFRPPWWFSHAVERNFLPCSWYHALDLRWFSRWFQWLLAGSRLGFPSPHCGLSVCSQNTKGQWPWHSATLNSTATCGTMSPFSNGHLYAGMKGDAVPDACFQGRGRRHLWGVAFWGHSWSTCGGKAGCCFQHIHSVQTAPQLALGQKMSTSTERDNPPTQVLKTRI